MICFFDVVKKAMMKVTLRGKGFIWLTIPIQSASRSEVKAEIGEEQYDKALRVLIYGIVTQII